MWLVTPLGAFSIRCTAADARKGTLSVESKVRSDLEALVAAVLPSACPIVEVLGRKRGYMIRVGRGEMALALATLVLDLHYEDFAEEFADQQGDERAVINQSLWQTIYSQ